VKLKIHLLKRKCKPSNHHEVYEWSYLCVISAFSVLNSYSQTQHVSCLCYVTDFSKALVFLVVCRICFVNLNNLFFKLCCNYTYSLLSEVNYQYILQMHKVINLAMYYYLLTGIFNLVISRWPLMDIAKNRIRYFIDPVR